MALAADDKKNSAIQDKPLLKIRQQNRSHLQKRMRRALDDRARATSEPLVVLTSALFALAILVAVPGPVVADINGKWRVEDENGVAEFVDVVDVEGAVSMTVMSFPFTGTLTSSTLALSTNACTFGCVIEATVTPGESYFDGRLMTLIAAGTKLGGRLLS